MELYLSFSLQCFRKQATLERLSNGVSVTKIKENLHKFEKPSQQYPWNFSVFLVKFILLRTITRVMVFSGLSVILYINK